MINLIRKALDAAGYDHAEATEQNLRDCAKDYADAGVWRDVEEPSELDTVPVDRLARRLLRYCGQ